MKYKFNIYKMQVTRDLDSLLTKYYKKNNHSKSMMASSPWNLMGRKVDRQNKAINIVMNDL